MLEREGGRGFGRLAAGMALVLLTALLIGAAQVVAHQQRHAYDPGAQPHSAQVTAEHTYQLSSSTPVARLIATGVLATLSCTYSADGITDNVVPLSSTLDDERNRYQFALFIAPVTGRIDVRCADIGAVFVDDADDATPDWAGLLSVLAVLTGLAGAVLTVATGYRLSAPADAAVAEPTPVVAAGPVG